MIDIKILLPELRKLVFELSEDLLARVTNDSAIDAGLRGAYTQIEKGGRTGDPYEVWLEDYLDQVAVAWVLSCVFVRFMEDNNLIAECWLSGEGERRKQAEETHELYFRQHPLRSDRDYFEHVFREIGKVPACRDLFAKGKTPLWAVGPSGDAAMKLRAFWREIDSDSGKLKRTFDVELRDTRFLGDLYQDLSEKARKKYALLQTPVFVEEFILDRTLDPAIQEFGLKNARLIDPTCGSGHFLLGGFARLFRLWSKPENTTGNAETDAQKALDGIWGCDINPFAIAIARFRLIVAALQACDLILLDDAPGWVIHLATGDSLLFGKRWDATGQVKSEQQYFRTEDEGSWAPEIYACEDRQAISEVLGQQYHAVVGNPPYIVVRDKCLNQAYRVRYFSCHRSYSLGVPFTERFFDLAIQAPGSQSGYVGMITANSFMKRVFGQKLIEQFLPKIDLTHVIDTSGAFIPGHTTSTVILFGRNRKPQLATLRAVLGILGEPSTPSDPSEGKVWKGIVSQIDNVGSPSEYVSSSDMERKSFATHPWSIGGGGAAELEEALRNEQASSLEQIANEIGFSIVTRDDDVFIVPEDVARRHNIPASETARIVSGDGIRDWVVADPEFGLFPYETGTYCAKASAPLRKFLWKWKKQLAIRVAYGMTQLERGNEWFEYSMIFRDRLRARNCIAFAEIATHNHFMLNKQRFVLNRPAPIITFSDEFTEDEVLSILGVLNSSAICFWAKQVMPCKGLGGQGGGIKTEHWFRAYVFCGTLLKQCPIPPKHQDLLDISKMLQTCAEIVEKLTPTSIVRSGSANLGESLRAAKIEFEETYRRMVALQEDLDWKVYALFGLVEEISATSEMLDEGIHPEDRPVERLLKRRIGNGEQSVFYEVHSYRGAGDYTKPCTPDWERLIEKRLQLISSTPELKLIEQPDFKRRWQVEPWSKQEHRALKNWLLDRLESTEYWGSKSIRLQSISELAGMASNDVEFMRVASLYRGREDFEVLSLVDDLIETATVPLFPILQFKDSGLRKHSLWTEQWEKQRQSDDELCDTTRQIPPRYTSADYKNSNFFRLRGRLGVPQERFLSFPFCETDGNPSLVVGWAGWSDLHLGTAIATYYDARKREGWTAERLIPLLAALDQLLPWIHQWHPEIDPEYNETAGTSFQTLLDSEAQELGLTIEDIRNWTPPAKKVAAKKSTPKQPRQSRKKKAEVEVEE